MDSAGAERQGVIKTKIVDFLLVAPSKTKQVYNNLIISVRVSREDYNIHELRK